MLRKLLITLCLGAFIIVAMGAGCKKKEPTDEEEKPEEPTEETE